MRSLILFLAISITFFSTHQEVFGQGEFSGGFKAGLNFSNFEGPVENDNESFSFNTGFHIGATIMYSFTDVFGLKGELIYSQKGTQYSYDGDSYFTFYRSGTNAGIPIYATGERRMDISVSNTYLDLPVMVYARVGRFELEAGLNAGILVSSRGSGGLTFSGTSLAGTPIAEFEVGLDHSYYSDNQGPNALLGGETVTINTFSAQQPTSIDAYYESADNDEKKYSTLDVGLNAGIGFFLNKGLFLGVRGNYGLSDITNEGQDLALADLGDGNSYQTRDDKDQNISVQVSVGFRF